MGTKELKDSLRAVLRYLNGNWDFVNCHMVNYLTDNHWERFVPENVRTSVGLGQNVEHCIEDVFWNTTDSTRYKDVMDFFKESKQFRLENMKHLLTSIEQLHEILRKQKSGNSLSIKEFMSEKKRHEVEITAELIDDLVSYQKAERGSCIFIVDAGDGKGYLSSRLAMQYEHNVLGIDSNETNTENAVERSKKLQRAWNGLTERAELQSKGITPPRRGKKQKPNRTDQPKPNNYKTTNKFITSQLDFKSLIQESFPNATLDDLSLCLIGLHTCGNLGPTCLNVFAAQSDFKILCNIGCCYHLLKEEFSIEEFFGNKEIRDMQAEPGFPMSSFLRDQQVKIGRNARMLAAQSIHRTQHAKELPNVSLFYRALLEVLIVEKNPDLKDTIQVGRIKKFSNFKEYMEACNKKANLGLEFLTEKYLHEVELRYAEQAQFLNLFHLIRMSFAPILETLILLDRLLYLREHDFERSYLIPLFDPVISPRHYCIVAIK